MCHINRWKLNRRKFNRRKFIGKPDNALPLVLPCSLQDIVDPHHVQYCGGISLEEQAGAIATAVGGRGPNTEYLYNTTDHLVQLGIQDAELDWLVTRVRQLVG